MTQQFYADLSTGRYLGSTDSTPPANSIEVPVPPESALHQMWDGSQWSDDPDRATQEQRVADIRTLLARGKDITLILIELVEWQLANTAMQATDFTPEVRQIYQDVKAIADRVKT